MATGFPQELTDLDLHREWVAGHELPATFDPFRWTHRVAAYRALLAATNTSEAFGPDNRRNPLWGLIFQLHWQLRTGRLGAAAHARDTIDPDSAWGYGNYTLCVLPWLGAERAGLVSPRTIADPPTSSRFRYVRAGRVPAELDAGVEGWREFFVDLAQLEHTRAIGPTAGEGDEQLRMAMWRAHKSCLDVVAARSSRDVPGPLPQTELDFLRGWCRMVDFLWAAAFPTDFEFTVAHGLDVLPERVLSGPETATQLPERAAGTTANVLGLAKAGPWRTRVSLWLWRRAMRTAQARSDVLTLLDAAFHRRADNAATRARLLWLVVAPRRRPHRGVPVSRAQASGRGAGPPGP
ncbi:MAG TPA: Leg1-related protein [Ornithinimicrobium sp.]|uniref:Leg1-related protein n=1 Tax=Ornithinimicrobium sp. TaxID=1977084 RepID=UPI002B494EBE|nr:Leg1-related protein [Ornithinimicrobium sp.]HKJ11767.1 Leg1-related protein [Ornithinimicrobium sp.]